MENHASLFAHKSNRYNPKVYTDKQIETSAKDLPFL